MIVNVKLLSDIDNRKPTIESNAAYVNRFLFLVKLSVVFSLGNQAFHFSKSWSPGELLGCLGRPNDPISSCYWIGYTKK